MIVRLLKHIFNHYIFYVIFIVLFTGGTEIFATEAYAIKDKSLIEKNMVVLDESSSQELAYISSDQSILLFRNSTPQLEELEVGNVLWLNATVNDNYGFLCQIERISKEESNNNKGLIIQTIPWIANHPPLISSLIVRPSTLEIGQQGDLTCYAADEDKDELFYNWISTGGTLLGNGADMTWIAPDQSGNYIINCEVTDRRGGKDIRAVQLWVAEEFSQLTNGEKELIRKYGWSNNRVIRWPDGYVEVYDATNYSRMQEVLDQWNKVIGGKLFFA